MKTQTGKVVMRRDKDRSEKFKKHMVIKWYEREKK